MVESHGRLCGVDVFVVAAVSISKITSCWLVRAGEAIEAQIFAKKSVQHREWTQAAGLIYGVCHFLTTKTYRYIIYTVKCLKPHRIFAISNATMAVPNCNQHSVCRTGRLEAAAPVGPATGAPVSSPSTSSTS